MPFTINQQLSVDGQKNNVVVGSGTAGAPVGGVLTIQGAANATPIPVTDPFDVTSGSINVTTQDLASSTVTGFANQSLITGTPTTNSAASFAVNSIQTVMVLISGTWTGTLSTEVSEDAGVTWEPRSIHVIGTSTFASAVTANVIGSMNGAGKSNIRVRATAAMTGTASIKIVTSDNPSNVYVANSIKLVDGSSTISTNMMAIKAGSTLPASTDTAVVVTLRDTSTIQGPSGTPGTPSGGILTIQGVSGGQAIPSNVTQLVTSSDKTGSGTIAALNGTIASTTNGCSIVSFNVTGTWVATIVVEGTIDAGVTWLPIDADVDATDTIISSFTTNSLVTINCASYSQVRLRASAYTSGTLAASWESGAGLSLVQVYNTNALSLKTTVVSPALTPSAPTFATIGVTSGTVIAANANRKGLVIQNGSSLATISLHLNNGSAVLNSGITLFPHDIWYMDEFTFTTAQINAISSLASTNVPVQEMSV